MRNKDDIRRFVEFSNKLGERIDYVQGGGGNTSYKVDEQTMLIKASGFYLSQITEQNGFAILNFPEIRKFFNQEGLDELDDIEAAGSAAVKSAKIHVDGYPELRPSVEAGFHSILGTWVAHSHSVYTSIILCSKKARELLHTIFPDHDYIYVPYVNPGSRLTAEVNKEMQHYAAENGTVPHVIFMQNHGIIVHADDMEACFNLHEQVNETICDYFRIDSSAYPEVAVEESGDDCYISATDYLIESLKDGRYSEEFLLQHPLYPDQIVYLKDVLGNTARIDSASGKISYHLPYKQALLLEQALTAIVFIMNHIEENNLGIQFMHDSEQDFIKNWESEKYRKELAEK